MPTYRPFVQQFEKDGYSIEKRFLYRTEPLPDTKGLSAAEFKRRALDRFQEEFILLKSKGAKDIYIGQGTSRIRRQGRRVFKSTRYIDYILYRDGRLTVRRTGACFTTSLLEEVIRTMRLECLYLPGEERTVDGTLSIALSCKTVLKKVLDGKVTNRRALMTEYLRAGYGIKPLEVPVAEADRFLRWSHDYSLADLRDYTTNLGHAVAFANSEENSDSLFRDLLSDAVLLDIRVNPRWSRRRMEQEHRRNIFALRGAELGEHADDNIYGAASVSGQSRDYSFTTVDTERKAFVEGLSMNHCVYTHYWPGRILRGDYVAVHMQPKDKSGKQYTIGIRRDPDRSSVSLDQVQGYGNSRPTDKAFLEAQGFVNANCDAILAMMDAAKRRPDAGERISTAAFAAIHEEEDMPF